jgi:hypothetical protein
MEISPFFHLAGDGNPASGKAQCDLAVAALFVRMNMLDHVCRIFFLRTTFLSML